MRRGRGIIVGVVKMLADISLPDRDRRAVERAAEILRTNFPVERIVLFGSKARGEDDDESDIDLLVLTRRPLGHAEQDGVTDALFDLQLELDVVISPLIVATEEWDRGLFQVLPIRHEVDRDGVAA